MKIRALAFAVLTICCGSAAYAETATTVTVTATQSRDDSAYLQRIAPQYLSVAGSQDNLASLTSGLRTGTPITLSTTNPDGTGGTPLTFTSPTKPMGYGNISHALDYATRDLAAAGVSSPTSDQLHAALMGGTVTNAAGETTVLPGVLQLRSQGMGWGQIAHQLNISPSPHANAAAAGSGITTAGSAASSVSSAAKPGGSGVVTANGNGLSHAKYSGGDGAKSGIVTAGGAGTGLGGGITNGNGGGMANGVAAGHISTAGGGSGHGNAYGKSKN